MLGQAWYDPKLELESSSFPGCSAVASAMPLCGGVYGWPPDKDGRLVIPSSVAFIGERAFQRCTGLTSVTIPSSDVHRLPCLFQMHWADVGDDPKLCDVHRRQCLLRMQWADVGDDPKLCDVNRQQCLLRMQWADVGDDPKRCDVHRRLCLLRMHLADVGDDSKLCDVHQRLCL